MIYAMVYVTVGLVLTLYWICTSGHAHKFLSWDLEELCKPVGALVLGSVFWPYVLVRRVVPALRWK